MNTARTLVGIALGSLLAACGPLGEDPADGFAGARDGAMTSTDGASSVMDAASSARDGAVPTDARSIPMDAAPRSDGAIGMDVARPSVDAGSAGPSDGGVRPSADASAPGRIDKSTPAPGNPAT